MTLVPAALALAGKPNDQQSTNQRHLAGGSGGAKAVIIQD
jgi:hypothetical protein